MPSSAGSRATASENDWFSVVKSGASKEGSVMEAAVSKSKLGNALLWVDSKFAPDVSGKSDCEPEAKSKAVSKVACGWEVEARFNE